MARTKQVARKGMRALTSTERRYSPVVSLESSSSSSTGSVASEKDNGSVVDEAEATAPVDFSAKMKPFIGFEAKPFAKEFATYVVNDPWLSVRIIVAVFAVAVALLQKLVWNVSMIDYVYKLMEHPMIAASFGVMGIGAGFASLQQVWSLVTNFYTSYMYCSLTIPSTVRPPNGFSAHIPNGVLCSYKSADFCPFDCRTLLTIGCVSGSLRRMWRSHYT